MTEYQGTIQNLSSTQKTSQAGKTYSVYTFNLDSVNTPFKNVYFKNGYRPIQGNKIRVVETQGSKGKDYEAYEVSGAAAPAAQAYTPPAANYGGKSETQQASIIRQFSVREAIALAALRASSGAIAAKTLKDDAAFIKLVASYAHIIHNAVKDEAGFNAFASFNGQVNEIGDELPDDMVA